MDNLPDTKIESTIESSPKSEEDEALDPRVQVCFSPISIFLTFIKSGLD
jgi:hypothetical protein